TPEGVPPPSYRYEGRRTSSTPKNCSFDDLDENGLLKPTGNVASRQRIIGEVLGVNVLNLRSKSIEYKKAL
ncbi:hypothetical protein, partial [Acinetobacter baumannii]|uniref:hypothetical protein n=1 Tax=Acinetobacter baumannii TaxID=470 RepID=UPI00312C7BD9